MESVNKKISGFPEFLPQQQKTFQKLIAKIQKIFESYGADPIETPAVERLTTLLQKGGNPKEIYGLRRVQSEDEGSKELGLKFDLTVPLARYVATHFQNLTFPFRRYQIQPVFRGERAQKGRYRQFYQCDFDIINQEKLSPYNSVEILFLIAEIFQSLGLGEFRIYINHREILQGYLKYYSNCQSEQDLAELVRRIDKYLTILHTNPRNNFDARLDKYFSGRKREEFFQFLDFLDETVRDKSIDRLDKFATKYPFGKNYQNAIQEMKQTFQILEKNQAFKNVFWFDPQLARGLDYYTGIVFETELKDYPELGSVCSGGRYDNLTSQFINKRLPGIGLSVGLSRLFDAILDSEKNTTKEQAERKLLITFMGADYLAENFLLAEKIRKIGVPVEHYLEEKKIKNQLSYAEKKNFCWVLLYGDEEKQKKIISIKNLSTREQTSINFTNDKILLAELENYFK